MERKKIVPKAKFDASKQEELLRKLQQDTASAVKMEEDEVKAPLVQQKAEKTVKKDNKPATTVKVLTNKEDTVIAQQNTEAAVKISNFTAASDKTGKIQRITVDMPLELYERMKDQVDDNGQTIKGFIVSLVKQHFAKK